MEADSGIKEYEQSDPASLKSIEDRDDGGEFAVAKEAEKSSIGITYVKDDDGGPECISGARRSSCMVHHPFPASPSTCLTISSDHPSNFTRRIVHNPDGSPNVSQVAPRSHTRAASRRRNNEETRIACFE